MKSENNATFARLERGEPVQMTPAQLAEFVRAQTLGQIAAGVEAAGREAQPITADVLNDILTRYGGNFGVWALFTRIVQAYRLTPQAFASGLAFAYVAGRPDRATAAQLFRIVRPCDIMSAEDVAALEELPARLTIYRGCSTSEAQGGAFGLSWTLSRAVAEWFAWRYDAADRGRVVLCTTIDRADVLAYFRTRGEDEIICFVEAPGVEVAAREPSALYWGRMHRGRVGL